jgi:hydroxymethylpyrimidine/phosphomethylpyrimidine kinase
MSQSPPIALTIAGSDPSGGAGIQADLKTFSAFGVYGASVITALTAQNTVGVTGAMTVPAPFIAEQFNAVASDLAIDAVKTGMLGDSATVHIVADLLRAAKLKAVVVDPVMVATSGDRLLDVHAVQAVRDVLIPLATIITPNIPEAAALLQTSSAMSVRDMVDQGRRLLHFGCGAVLLKGGHGDGDQAVDVLVTGSGAFEFADPRIVSNNTHGTGCTLAAAITAGLAQGIELADAVGRAKAFVWQAIASSAQWQVGKGHGPVDHLFNVRKKPTRSE